MSQIENVDVLIVGSGPSGTSTALHLVKKNPSWAERIIIVEKETHPREKLCGGGVTHLGQNVLARLGLSFDVPNFEVKEARLLYQDQSYSFFADPVFRITRRAEFDHWLVQTAEKLGIQVHQGEAVLNVTPYEEYVEVETEKGIFHAKVLVAADGSRSFVRRKLKWPGESHVARLMEVLTPEEATSQSQFREGIAIFDFTPMINGLQGYYWDFPSYIDGQPVMNRGIFDSRARTERPKADLKKILRDSLAERDRDLGEYKLKGHPIRWWNRKNRFAMPRILLVGDAAGADPLVGEGISFALGYGDVAAGAIENAFSNQDFSFEDYRDRLLKHPLFHQLDIRTRVAKMAYKVQSPWLTRAVWLAVGEGLRRTRWGDPSFDPTERPHFRLLDANNPPVLSLKHEFPND
ncbi:MAG: NAD(P)/FAD-dependent oxidoreductase [Candidatus Promineifilaceae bacterium]|jgi:geranylgeranyl reductase family protein